MVGPRLVEGNRASDDLNRVRLDLRLERSELVGKPVHQRAVKIGCHEDHVGNGVVVDASNSNMNDSLKFLLVGFICLVIGYLLGVNSSKTSGAQTSNGGPEYLLSTPDAGRFPTETRSGRVWVLSSPNNSADVSAYHWTEIPTPSPR